MNVRAGVCDAGRHSDRHVDGARDASVLGAAAAAELYVQGGEERSGGADYHRDGAAHLLRHQSGQLALERAQRRRAATLEHCCGGLDEAAVDVLGRTNQWP